MPRHVTSRRETSRHVASYRVMSRHVVLCLKVAERSHDQRFRVHSDRMRCDFFAANNRMRFTHASKKINETHVRVDSDRMRCVFSLRIIASKITHA